MDRPLAPAFPPHQAYLDYWVAPNATDVYMPMADGLSLLSNGYGFYEAFSFPPDELCQLEPAPAPVDVHMEYESEFQIPYDQSRTTRFFSPSEISTPPGTPARTPACAPSPPALPMLPEPRDASPAPVAAAMSPADARQLIEDYLRRSTWFEANAVEPLVGDIDVPTSALLLARPGESVYRVFVDTKKDRKGKPVYFCCACPFKSDRLHRVIGHQRSKRGHRPFPCPDEGCDFHGYSAESLGDHRSGRNGLQTCERCGETIVKKNMSRHLQVMHDSAY